MHARTRSWLALLLFLHVLVHPIVHASPLLGTASGPTTLSAAVADKHSHTGDCELCRIANRLVPIVAFAAPAAREASSPVVKDQIADIFAVAQLYRPSRAPPVR